jgi:hypothetical protein
LFQLSFSLWVKALAASTVKQQYSIEQKRSETDPSQDDRQGRQFRSEDPEEEK